MPLVRKAVTFSFCHVGYAIDEQPYVTPTKHWRDADTLYWLGSRASKMLCAVRMGFPACVTAGASTAISWPTRRTVTVSTTAP